MNPVYKSILLIILYQFFGILCNVVTDCYDNKPFYLLINNNYWENCTSILILSIMLTYWTIVKKEPSNESSSGQVFGYILDIALIAVVLGQMVQTIMAFIEFNIDLIPMIWFLLLNIAAVVVYRLMIYITKMSDFLLSKKIIIGQLLVLVVTSVCIAQCKLSVHTIYTLSKDAKMYQVIQKILIKENAFPKNETKVYYGNKNNLDKFETKLLKSGRLKYKKLDNKDVKMSWKPFTKISKINKSKINDYLKYEIRVIPDWYFGNN